LKKFARIPLRYYLSIPGTIRLLAAGILINKVGGFVTIFLTLILALRHIPAAKIAVALALSAVFAIIGSWLGGALISRLGGRWTIFLAMMGSAAFTAALVFPSPYPVVVAIVCLIALCNRAYVPATATMVASFPGLISECRCTRFTSSRSTSAPPSGRPSPGTCSPAR
jgi:predicted MFS family arabinose efflux permease